VLVWNLRAGGDSLVGQVLNLHADIGEPVRLTLSQLRKHGVGSLHPPADRVISICENPSVVEAAARKLGVQGRTLICTEGQPSVAVVHLLTELAEAGYHLRYHGDFDWGGIRIGNRMWNLFPGLTPWRFSSGDYAEHSGTRQLNAQTVTVVWDSDLANVMKQRGTAVEEELVLADLISDLSGHERSGV